MYKFPENLYTDIRIDNYSETQLTYDVEVLAEIIISCTAKFIKRGTRICTQRNFYTGF